MKVESKYTPQGALGTRLSDECEKLGISRKKAAINMGMDPKSFYANISGRTYPRLETIIKYHDYFKISMDELIDLTLEDTHNDLRKQVMGY